MLEAAGGTVESVRFSRGRYDVTVEITVPSQEALLGGLLQSGLQVLLS